MVYMVYMAYIFIKNYKHIWTMEDPHSIVLMSDYQPLSFHGGPT